MIDLLSLTDDGYSVYEASRINWMRMQADLADFRRLAWGEYVNRNPATVESLRARLAEFQSRLDAAKRRMRR